jgi:hypothetical protein
MNKSTFLLVAILCSFLTATVIYSCKKTAVAPPAPVNLSFKEEFDTIATLYNRGWAFVNNSTPQGTATWQQGVFESDGKGGVTGFAAYSSKSNGQEYAYCGFNAGGGLATVSSWMISPSTVMKNGDKISFWTRTALNSSFPDRMQFRLNLNNDDVDIQNRVFNSVGSFDKLIFDINPTYAPASNPNTYPQKWTKYEHTISGLVAPVKCRFAFRYFVEQGGPSGANSNFIGIDDVEFISK